MPSSRLGSAWRRWDLHVHTPDSLSQNYGGNDPWDRFLNELASLPPEMSVVGINDYIFIDGYRRVLDAYQTGRLPNLEAVFPVVELRLMQLAGVEGEFRRINYHVIFEEQFDPDIVEAQFINGLSAHYQLALAGPQWSGFPTRSNLSDLGQQIREAMPEIRRRDHPESDLQLGFANLVVNLEDVVKGLSHSSLRGHAITAIGKAEWASLRWTDQSIAAKKHIINHADIVFTAAEFPVHYDRARQALADQGVNDRLLDCSDAHSWSDSAEKDRIGNCWTWINAQPTLEGLRHALTEFDHRVFVGTYPKKLDSVRLRPGDHIRRVTLGPAANPVTTQPALFDCSIDINPGFVAVVGNKGKGKSALLDAIGLASDCTTEHHFTFLSKDRFRNPLANRAADHIVQLEWCDGEKVTRGLDAHVSALAPPRVTYLPQRLLDLICSADPGEPSAAFARELETVLFAHVPVADRLGATNLRALIATRTAAIETQLTAFRAELATLDRSIVEAEGLLKPDRRVRLKEARTQLEKRLVALTSAEPVVPPVPDEIDPILADEIATCEAQYSTLLLDISALHEEDTTLAAAIDAAAQFGTEAETLQRQVSAFIGSNAQRTAVVGVGIDDVVSFELNLGAVDAAVAIRTARRAEIAKALSPVDPGSLLRTRDNAKAALQSAQSRLDLPARLRAEAEAEHRAWAEACTELQDGSIQQTGIGAIDQELRVISDAPGRLTDLRNERNDLTVRIHAALVDKVAIYEQLYRPAREFIDRHSLAAQSHLTFSATLQERNLEQKFFDLVSRGKSGTFMGLDEGAAQLRKRQEAYAPSDPASVIQFLDGVDDALHIDRRTSSVIRTDPEQCLRAGHDLQDVYDLLFGLSYLEPQYTLQYQNTDLDALSPGEKGTLLLMFYLLVDPGRCPLLLDQPDENLDNQTVKNLLVPAIKEASTRRQVIAVTHNPNVAIVADADQVIVATRGKSGFGYQSGAIEDGLINRDAVDVLEGTWSAFRNRQEKYQPPEGRSAV